MTGTTDHDRAPGLPVIIAGGGLGGLAAAVGLERAGVPVLVVERSTGLDQGGAHLGVQSNAVRALARLGLADEVARHGTAVHTFRFRSWSGRGLAAVPLHEVAQTAGAPSLVLARRALHGALFSALRSQVRFGAAVTGVQVGGDVVTVRLDTGEDVLGRALIGADGLRSQVRTLLHGAQDPRWTRCAAWRGVAHLPEHGLPVGLATQTLGRGRQFGSWVLDEDRVYWVASRYLRDPSRPAGSESRGLERAFAGAHHPILSLLRATEPDTILFTPLYDRAPLGFWGSGPISLLGDAAHPTTPHTGQGAGMAIEDAVTLADELGAVIGPGGCGRVDGALRRYETRRLDRTAQVTKEAAALGRLYHVRHPLVAALRNCSFRLTPTQVWRTRFASRLVFDV